MYDLCDHYITANIVIFVIFSLTPRMARLGGAVPLNLAFAATLQQKCNMKF